MIPLGSKAPTDTATLRTALTRALAASGVPADAVAAEGEFPNVSALRLHLTGAQFTRGMAPPKPGAERQAGFFARTVEVLAAPASIEGVPFHLTLHAEDAVFAFAKNSDGQFALVIESAARGDAEFRVAGGDLENALASLARNAAEKQGAEIQGVTLRFTADGPRTLNLTAGVSAKAMFLAAKVAVSGRLVIGDSLDATVHGLACTGEGMLGNMAAGVLRPKFAQFEGRAFPLAKLLPGLCDASFDASGGGLCVRVKFGRAT
jgi:hypothetical protein